MFKTMLSFNITKGRKGGKVYFGLGNYRFHFCVSVSQLLNQPQQVKEHYNPGLHHTVMCHLTCVHCWVSQILLSLCCPGCGN